MSEWSSMQGILTMVLAIVGMIAIAIVAWHVVQRQEANDPELERKLKADDDRARASLMGQLPSQAPPPQAPPSHKSPSRD